MPKKIAPEHKIRLPWGKILIPSIIVLILGTWVWWITNTSQFVTSFIITTSEPEDTSLVERYVEQYLDTKLWFGLTKRRHESLLQPDKLRSDLLSLFPVFSSATLAIFDHQLVIELTSRQASALWCETNPKQEEQCWFIDQERVMYRKAPQFSEGVYIKYGSTLHTTPSLGDQVLDTDMRLYTSQIVKLLEENNLEPTRVVQQTNDRVAFHIQKLFDLKLPEQARIITSTQQSPQAIAERLTLLLAAPAFVEEVKTMPEKFEYADLRFPGRLVYKLDD